MLSGTSRTLIAPMSGTLNIVLYPKLIDGTHKESRHFILPRKNLLPSESLLVIFQKIDPCHLAIKSINVRYGDFQSS